MDAKLNVLGEPLKPCSTQPLTGFFRDGCCNTSDEDLGRHVVCVRVTREFLEFSRMRGNDLITPMPEYGFPGLQPGDQWCLCAVRFIQAVQEGVAPAIRLEATHILALTIVPIQLLMEYAVDAPV